MCGIAGYLDAQVATAEREAAVARMCRAMQHRGPDDEGRVSVGSASLGMRRLAIFDPANGRQPMSTPDGRYHLIFNGAIYNHRELRAELASGFAFKTNCDTEVLLAAFARWGDGCLTRLRGMFAFAVWDANEQKLFLARDAFGIKPLYVFQAGRRLLFASEVNALLASGAIPAEIDAQAVADYLAWLAVPAPRTIWRGIISLRPGECATFANSALAVCAWWSFSKIPATAQPCRTREEFVHELRRQLEAAIQAHMLADVPVGAFLSGGIDSSAVVGLMQRVSSSRLKTFSIGFGETAYSEAQFAEQTARHFGTEHHASVLTGAQVAGDLDHILGAFDQPTGDGINTFYVSQAARAGGVTGALSGLGGDELFGGYPSFRDTPRLARWLPRWRLLPGGLRNFIHRRLACGDTRARKLADFFYYARTLPEVASLQRRVFSKDSQCALLHSDFRATVASEPPFHPQLNCLAADLGSADAFETVSAWELRTYMADVLLRDSDVMSMRHSLELRVPFIDRPLVEWLWHQPARFKEDTAKSALAAAVFDLLPAEVGHRRKQGFTLPFAVWMRSELRPFLEETFSTSSVNRSGFFSAADVQSLWRHFLKKHDIREWSRVWSLAMLIAFVNRAPSFQLQREHLAALP